MFENHRLEFEVYDIHKYKRGVILSGRCVDGVIKPNDCFSFLYELDYKKEEGVSKVIGYKNLEDIEMIVQEIECYRKPVQELVKGYSGGLYIVGSNILEEQTFSQLQVANTLPFLNK